MRSSNKSGEQDQQNRTNFLTHVEPFLNVQKLNHANAEIRRKSKMQYWDEKILASTTQHQQLTDSEVTEKPLFIWSSL